MGSTWRAHIHVEKNGETAVYDDLVSTRRHEATAAEIEQDVVGEIIRRMPQFSGGRVTRHTIVRIH